MATAKKTESPNVDIDKAIKALMAKISEDPTDVAVKVLNTAIAWEKAKHAIVDKETPFNPDDI